MIQIRFIAADGTPEDVVCEPGQSLMNAAVAHNVKGINADCGGAMACGTCHVYVEAGHEDKLPAAAELEAEMLSLGHNTRPNSRLSCQIWLDDGMDGLVVHTPESQYL